MILFDGKEQKYIKDQFEHLLNNDGKYEDSEAYQGFKDSLGTATFDRCKKVLINLNKINTDEDINKTASMAIEDVLGFFVWDAPWRHLHFTVEEVKTYIDDPIFLSLYKKICCQDDEE